MTVARRLTANGWCDDGDSVTDLIIRGGTVVTATGSRVADLAFEGRRIVAVETDLAGLAAGADDVIDATGLLVLPGVVDVHTHTRVASDAEPDRFFQDPVAAAFGGTTTFLSFNDAEEDLDREPVVSIGAAAT